VSHEARHKTKNRRRPAIAGVRQSLSVGDYLKQLVEKELPLKPEGPDTSKGSGMVLENGIWVYDNGEPVPLRAIDDAIRQVREERMRQILGKNS